jgi:hypothetical protein
MRRDFRAADRPVSGRWQRFILGGFMTAIVSDAFLEGLKEFAEARVQRGLSQSRRHLMDDGER